jgi:hypothetical protein
MYGAQRGQLSTAPSSARMKFVTCTKQAAAAGDQVWPDYSSDSALVKDLQYGTTDCEEVSQRSD